MIAGAALYGASGVLIGQAIGGVVFAGISLWLMNRVATTEGSGHHAGAFQPHLRDHVVSSRRH